MLQKLIERRHKGNEEGFTLIELMVVVLIIAILIAIAIPTFLGARDRAQDRSAQSNLRNALTSAKTVYSDNQTYGTSASLVTAAGASAPELTFQTTASTTNKQISVAVSNAGQTVNLVVRSDTGSCFAMTDVSTGASAGTTGPTKQASCTAA